MTAKNPKLRIESVQTVPPDAEVCDFDELDDAVGHQFTALVAAEADEPRPTPDESTVEAFEDCSCDIVKFTDFYRVVPS